jgi:ribonuclease-3
LKLAVSHRSWCAENGHVESNERLEFLGDAVLGLAIADKIFVHYPELPEGQLSKLRAGVVNSVTLAEIAREIRLGDALRLGKGERATGGSDKQSILADGLEAIIGAVYLDGGIDAAQALVLRLWDDHVAAAVRHGPGGFDHKTPLQELAVATFEIAPFYDVAATGPDHARVFDAQVSVGEDVLGTGTGTTKKEAEQAAAGQAVDALKKAALAKAANENVTCAL